MLLRGAACVSCGRGQGRAGGRARNNVSLGIVTLFLPNNSETGGDLGCCLNMSKEEEEKKEARRRRITLKLEGKNENSVKLEKNGKKIGQRRNRNTRRKKQKSA